MWTANDQWSAKLIFTVAVRQSSRCIFESFNATFYCENRLKSLIFLSFITTNYGYATRSKHLKHSTIFGFMSNYGHKAYDSYGRFVCYNRPVVGVFCLHVCTYKM